MGKTASSILWATSIANDESHGYDQNHRWGPNYDCSSMLIQSWENAGVPVKSAGATYTGNMRPIFLANGFSDVTYSVNLRTGAGLQPGDVLLNYSHHTAMYIGDGMIVHASINEFGKAVGGQTGDQTGREICVRSYYNYPWDCVLRYNEDDDSPYTPMPVIPDSHADNVRRGQQAANDFVNHDKIVVDGEYGQETKKMKIRVLQHAMNLDYRRPKGLPDIAEDGEWGPISDGVLGTHYIKRDETQYMVTAMEIFAYMCDNDPHGIEYPGIFGPGLEAVLKTDYCSTDYIRWVFVAV